MSVKYVIILGDGMSDLPVAKLDGKTPLMLAHKPGMDYLAQNGEVGLVKTIPDSCYPGSDTANLSVLGYDPEKYYTGRSPLEAVSMGIDLLPGQTAFRCNLVSVSDEDEYGDKTMLDYSADEITTEEARELINFAEKHFNSDIVKLYAGVSYRHCLVWDGYEGQPQFSAPHDITGQKLADNMPRGQNTAKLADIMCRSYDILNNHPINIKRRERGLKPGNSLWFWGPGTRPQLDDFKQKFGVSGAVISAVDLLKGIAVCAGMRSIDVEGATGNINTNYAGKSAAAAKALIDDNVDLVYVHIEAPDECGHRKELDNKIKAIEYIDAQILRPLMQKLDGGGHKYCVMVLPDHPTPVELGSHTRDAVPYIIYKSFDKTSGKAKAYDEESAKLSGIFIEQGYTLMQKFIAAGKDVK